MAWDLASLFVRAINTSSRCWDGMNVYDTKSGTPCIDFQFVECSFHSSENGAEVPLMAGFVYPTSLKDASKDAWSLRFQLNYKTRPVRAVQVISSKGETKDAKLAYGQWVVNYISGSPFQIAVSYDGKTYQKSQPVKPSGTISRKTNPDKRYSEGDFSHVDNVPLIFKASSESIVV